MIAFFQNLVVHDFWLKLFSLVCAVLIWLTVTLTKEGRVGDSSARLGERVYFNIPVKIKYMATDAVLGSFRVSPSEVEIMVRGAPDLLDKLHAKDIEAEVELTGVEGMRNLRKRIEVKLPAGIKSVSVFPVDVEVIPDR